MLLGSGCPCFDQPTDPRPEHHRPRCLLIVNIDGSSGGNGQTHPQRSWILGGYSGPLSSAGTTGTPHKVQPRPGREHATGPHQLRAASFPCTTASARRVPASCSTGSSAGPASGSAGFNDQGIGSELHGWTHERRTPKACRQSPATTSSAPPSSSFIAWAQPSLPLPVWGAL